MGRPVLIVTLFFMFLLCPQMSAQWNERIACWNVENLFDTIPNPRCEDRDFTPQGRYHWNSHRYWYKLGLISRTIAGMGGASPCGLVGLVEVENDSVLHDLTRRTSLAKLGYEFLITHGPDVRGINVALLYQPMRFLPIVHDTIRVAPLDGGRWTRDILHVAGRISTGDTLDIFVVHLPSRRGGKSSQKYRDKIAAELTAFADSIQAARVAPHIIMMGDFNADSKDKIFPKFFRRYTSATKSLPGTYYFQREWSQIDHFVVNQYIIDNAELQAYVHKSPYLLKENATDDIPRRTYLGPYYQGGISDHLPIVLDIHKK